MLPALDATARDALAGNRIKRRTMKHEHDKQAALGRLIKLAQGDTGKSLIAANFLLAWWDAASYGGFDPKDMGFLDPHTAVDIVLVLALIAEIPDYPVALAEQIETIIHAWRKPPLGCGNAAPREPLLVGETC